MRPVAIDPEALRGLAAAAGIDTVRELADRAEISEWVLYKGLRSGHMQPSHVLAIAAALEVDADAFAPQEASA